MGDRFVKNHRLKGLGLLLLAVTAFLVPLALSAGWLSTTTWLIIVCGVCVLLFVFFGGVLVYYTRKVRELPWYQENGSNWQEPRLQRNGASCCMLLVLVLLALVANALRLAEDGSGAKPTPEGSAAA